MARQAKFPPTIHRHASGQAMIRWKGHDYYLGKYGSEEARLEYARLIGHLAGQVGPQEALPLAPIGLTVLEVLDRWTTHASTYYSERGRECEQYRLALRPVRRLFGEMAASSFDADSLRRLQQAMLDGSWMTETDRQHHRVPKIGGWCRNVVNARVKRIRTVWRWAEEAKLVPPGVWNALRAVREVKRNRAGAKEHVRARTTSLAEVKAVCQHLSPLARAMLLLQFWTGMRSGELRAIRAADVDTSADVWTYRPRQHKTDYLGHDRIVMIGRKGQAVLGALLVSAAATGPDSPVFPSRTGQPFTRSGYAQAVRRAGKAANLPHFYAYLNRHCTRMRLSRLAGDEAARSILGHSRLDTSLGYGQIDYDLARKAARKLG